MPGEIVNNLRVLLFGGEGAPQYAPEGLLEKRGLSVEQLAREAGITRSAIYLYTSGRSRPTEETLLRICAVLDIPYFEGVTYCTPAQVGRPRQP